MRFRLVELFGLTAVLALGIGALLRSGGVLPALFFSLTLCILLAAVLCAIARRGENRYFWIGFSVAAIGYLWCVSGGVGTLAITTGLRNADDFGDFYLDGSEALVTTRVLHWLWGRMYEETPRPTLGGMMSVPSLQLRAGGPREVVRFAGEPFFPVDQFQGNQTLAFGGGQVVAGWEPDYSGFMRTGHCLWALLVALVAGCFTRWVHSFAVDSSS